MTEHRWSLVLAVLAGCSGDPQPDDPPGGDTGSTSSTSATSGTSGVDPTSGTGEPAICEAGIWSGNGEDGAEDTSFGMGDDMPLPLTIYDVQQGMASEGERVVLNGVVVITPSAMGEDLGGRERFVQELAGGAYSGLRIQASVFDLDAALAVGDTADIIGRLTWHVGYAQLTVESADDITITGTAPLPAPVVVDIADLHADDPLARPYEGVPVRVEMAAVTDDDPCDGEFTLEDTVRVDDRFMPDAIAAPQPGQVFTAVEGVLVYAYDSYELAPPDPAAIQ